MPMRQTRENLAAGIVESRDTPKSLKALLPEGVEDARCMADERILLAGAAIKRGLHIEGLDGEPIWIFLADEAVDRLLEPDTWRSTTLSEICSCDADVRPILSAPLGSAFKRGTGGLFVHDTFYEEIIAMIFMTAQKCRPYVKASLETLSEAFKAASKAKQPTSGGTAKTSAEQIESCFCAFIDAIAKRRGS